MIALLTLLLAAPVASESGLQCKFPAPHNIAIRRAYELPKKVQAALGPTADFGAPFNYTDVREQALPNQMLVFGERLGSGWMVHILRGGLTPRCTSLFFPDHN